MGDLNTTTMRSRGSPGCVDQAEGGDFFMAISGDFPMATGTTMTERHRARAEEVSGKGA
jgi:hypothetical protein